MKKRPDFTEHEEYLINLTKNDRRGSIVNQLPSLLWVLMPLVIFIYGIYNSNTAMTITAFVMMFLYTSWLIYYQIRPDWSFKPVVDKYDQYIESLHKTQKAEQGGVDNPSNSHE